MPEGLVSALNEDEIWDLIAYLQSKGNATYGAFSN
jgi:hypothetical protein